MKTLIAFGILLIACTTLQAASLKNLSEKLSIVSKTNENGEKVISDNTNKQLHQVDSRDEDESVAELDKLRNHHRDMDNEIESNESLEMSLRKLHDKNPHHRKSQKLHASFQDTSPTPKQKEIIEILPLPDDSSEPATSTTSAIRVDQSTSRTNSKNDIALTPANILRHLNGKYSAYDMAQYVFWTGDEEGVAKAVEELIDNGLMGRENALEFLSDIRTGMEYLESTYNFNTEPKDANPHPKIESTAAAAGNNEELPFSIKYQRFHSSLNPHDKEKVELENLESPTLSPIAFKALEKLPSLLKLTETHKNTNFNQPENLEPFEDENERSRLADFLYGEYSLEEVIYQLAKTMFTQSLTTGSEESQLALQKLTEYLEKEGKHGRISASLQKKILDVLLAALSDTLNENPEIMDKVRHAIEKN